jgi:hypothetical protein
VQVLSDESGDVDGDVGPRIVEASAPGSCSWTTSCVRREAAERLRRDHEHFRADHAAGAFRVLGPVAVRGGRRLR